MFPSKSDCYQLWNKYDLPEKKRIHSEIISNVAIFLGEKLQKKGIDINFDLLTVACLLHDIDKNVPREKHEHHPEVAVRILEKEGLGKIAKMVKTHSLHCILDPYTEPKTWEQKLLYLADKMVKYEFVGVDGRFELWKAEELPQDVFDVLEATYPKVKKLEQEVFVQCGTSLDEMRGIDWNK